MANIGVRSPYFYSLSNASGENFKIEITINSTLRYTLAKVTPDEAHFEVSELIRDYIDIEYNGTMPTDPADSSSGWSADVSITNYVYSDTAGTTQIATSTDTFDAFDGYAFFEDQDKDFTLPANGLLLTSTVVWLPENTAGVIYYTATDVVTKYNISTSAEGDITVGGVTVTIRRFDCTKYDPVKVVFVNRFGMPQELWFFGRTTESSRFQSDQYKSADITGGGVYSKYKHQYKKFDTKGQKGYVINTGFVSEDYNDSIDELLMSDQVWMHIDGTVRPINVTTSDVTYRTSLNDKMVQYTLEVQQANDLISTMR